MPYIKQKDRERVDDTVVAKTRGELNYLISKSLNKHIKTYGLSYQVCDEILD